MKYKQNWDNSHFYNSTHDPKIDSDIAKFKLQLASISSLAELFEAYLQQEALPQWSDQICLELTQIFDSYNALLPKVGNLRMYVESAIDIDNTDVVAQRLQTVVQQLVVEQERAFTPIMGFLARVDDGFISQLLAQEFARAHHFKIKCKRQFSNFLLPVVEEKLVFSLEQNSLNAWRNLNQEFWGNLTGEVDGKSHGLDHLYNMLSDENRELRKQAYRGIQKAWENVGSSQAAVLNAMNGCRIEVRNKRSAKQKLHFLDQAVLGNHISRKTLDAMMSAVYKRRDIGHRALGAMQKHLKTDQMMPWDLYAPAPLEKQKTYNFDDALDLIAKCFTEFDPKMGEFVFMMAKNGWIQAEVNEKSNAGAYCDRFSEPREPRIFMNFIGTTSNVTTLAHELGHAWHYWVMRHLDEAEADYAHSVAETASLFAENLVKQYLLKQPESDDIKLRIGWEDATSAALYLINIPTRFDFEQNLIRQREKGYVPEIQLCELMQQAAQKWYGDGLGEFDEYLWATIGHFSIADTTFYNFPYIFGYLFSLGIMKQQDEWGDRFSNLYRDLLRDTGRMSVENLVMKYLDENIEDESFWHDSLDLVEQSILQFESLEIK